MPVKLSVKVENKASIKDIKKFAKRIPTALERATERGALFVAGRVQKDYLQGPSPVRLAKKSTRLFMSITQFVERERKGVVRGFIGTNVVSQKGGFNYPFYWETSGAAHGGPRPFLVPAIIQNRRKIDKIIVKSMKKDLSKKL